MANLNLTVLYLVVSDPCTHKKEAKAVSHRTPCLRWDPLHIAHGGSFEVRHRPWRSCSELITSSPFFSHSRLIHRFATLILFTFLALRFLWTHLILRTLSDSAVSLATKVFKVDRWVLGVSAALSLTVFIFGMVKDRHWAPLNLVGAHPWHIKEPTAHIHSCQRSSVC